MEPGIYGELHFPRYSIQPGIADDPNLTNSERREALTAQDAFFSANHFVIHLSTAKGPKLGEAVVNTGYLEAVLFALQTIGRAPRVTVVVDKEAESLFSQEAYRNTYWENIHIVAAPQNEQPEITSRIINATSDEKVLLLSLGHNFEHPLVLDASSPTNITSEHGFRHAFNLVRATDEGSIVNIGYPAHTFMFPYESEERFARYIEDICQLRRGLIPQEVARQVIRLTEEEGANREGLLKKLGVDPNSLLVLCGFESTAEAKEYGRWREVLTLFSGKVKQEYPGKKIDFLVLTGSEDTHSLKYQFSDFTGIEDNARVLVRHTSLRDAAIIASRQAAVEHGQQIPVGFATDSFIGHLLAAGEIHTAIPYLHSIWTSNYWRTSSYQHGVDVRELGGTRSGSRERRLVKEVNTRRGHTVIDTISPRSLVSALWPHAKGVLR